MDVGGMMGSSGAAFPPISNYKGVMLCDRPSADVGKSNKPAPFNSAVVPPEQLGLAPPFCHAPPRQPHAVEALDHGCRVVELDALEGDPFVLGAPRRTPLLPRNLIPPRLVGFEHGDHRTALESEG